MQDIKTWLHGQIADVLSQGDHGKTKSDYEYQAKLIWTAGINEGYTNSQIKEACRGDIETYLLRQSTRTEDITSGMLLDKYSG